MPLAPTPGILAEYKARRLNWEGYVKEYQARVLSKLDRLRVARELDGSILLCWERDRLHCHRSLVSTWLEEAIGEKVPEWEAP